MYYKKGALRVVDSLFYGFNSLFEGFKLTFIDARKSMLGNLTLICEDEREINSFFPVNSYSAELFTMMISRRCFVSGRVQGVYFRASTHDKAAQLGVSAQAVNLADGRVKVSIQGASAQVSQLERWLWEGPPLARVDHVECADMGT
uniref:acylphosphatase n=1 Tax=Candidatus Kentrum sp. MB TaxID=2138164 RepID=A0A450XP52_9GAMM|nr:MAG: Acylphosphatase [Candidatus Kentron sp. MB]VFK31024.1 MAG: Acylphosphatase [Candidatus Kentron sp. MB]VFK75487.1 MAG: Acylphosphatase [Candidatus Kentron sp. MB]